MEKIDKIPNIKQSSLSDALFDKEELFWVGKPQKKAYVLGAVFNPLFFIVLIWLAVDIGMIIGITAIPGAPGFMLYILIPFFAFHLLPVWIYVAGIIKRSADWKNIEYAVTDKRIIFRTGLMGIDFDGIMFADIASVSVNVSPLQRMMGVGSVVFRQNSGAGYIFLCVEDPYKIYKFCQKLVQDLKTDVYYPNALRPESNPGYQTKYKPTENAQIIEQPKTEANQKLTDIEKEKLKEDKRAKKYDNK